MDRNTTGGSHTTRTPVVPRKGDVDRNPDAQYTIYEREDVVPRKGDVDRNLDLCQNFLDG